MNGRNRCRTVSRFTLRLGILSVAVLAIYVNMEVNGVDEPDDEIPPTSIIFDTRPPRDIKEAEAQDAARQRAQQQVQQPSSGQAQDRPGPGAPRAPPQPLTDEQRKTLEDRNRRRAAFMRSRSTTTRAETIASLVEWRREERERIAREGGPPRPWKNPELAFAEAESAATTRPPTPSVTPTAVSLSATPFPTATETPAAKLPSGRTVRQLFSPTLDTADMPAAEIALHRRLAFPLEGCNATWIARLQSYAAFHASALTLLREKKPLPPGVRVVIYRCWELPDHVYGTSTDCGGLADRISGMNHVFLLALYYNWVVLVDWQAQPDVFHSPLIDYEYKKELLEHYPGTATATYLFTSCPNSGDYPDCPLGLPDPPSFFKTPISVILINRGGIRWGHPNRTKELLDVWGLGRCVCVCVCVCACARAQSYFRPPVGLGMCLCVDVFQVM